MLYLHYVLVCITCLLGSLDIIKFLRNYFKFKSQSDFFQFFIYIFLGFFSICEFTIIYLSVFNDVFNTPFFFNESISLFFNFIVILTVIIGVVVSVVGMLYVFKMARITLKIRKWSVVSIIVILIIIIWMNINEFSASTIDGYPVVLSNFPVFYFVINAASFGLFSLLIYPNYLTLIKAATTKRKKTIALNYSIFLMGSLGVYFLALTGRVCFGNSWIVIIICDIFMIMACFFGFFAGYTYGFSETLISIMSTDAIYVAHNSGKTMYIRNFAEKGNPREHLLSSFFTAIDNMVQVASGGESRIKSITLEDNSEIYFASNHDFSIILIANRYYRILEYKMQELLDKTVRIIDNESIKEWGGNIGYYTKQINAVIEKVF